MYVRLAQLVEPQVQRVAVSRDVGSSPTPGTNELRELFSMFDVSFRCYYPNGASCDKHQSLLLADIPKWIDAYKFTHPDCVSITVKVWFNSSTN